MSQYLWWNQENDMLVEKPVSKNAYRNIFITQEKAEKFKENYEGSTENWRLMKLNGSIDEFEEDERSYCCFISNETGSIVQSKDSKGFSGLFRVPSKAMRFKQDYEQEDGFSDEEKSDTEFWRLHDLELVNGSQEEEENQKKLW